MGYQERYADTALCAAFARQDFDILGRKLQNLVEKTMRKNGDDPYKAVHSGISGLMDEPELVFAMYGPEKIQADFLNHLRAWRQVKLQQASEAEEKAAAERQTAQRKEAQAGHVPRADKAATGLPAAPRRNDGEVGHPHTASDGHVQRAPAPSSQGDGKGHGLLAGDGQTVHARPSSAKGDGAGQDHGASDGQTAAAQPSPSVRGAGAIAHPPKGQTASAPAAAKPAPKPVPIIPVKQERKPLFDPEAVRQMNREIIQVEGPTFKVWDGRDFGQLGEWEWADARERSMRALMRARNGIMDGIELVSNELPKIITIDELTRRKKAGEEITHDIKSAIYDESQKMVKKAGRKILKGDIEGARADLHGALPGITELALLPEIRNRMEAVHG